MNIKKYKIKYTDKVPFGAEAITLYPFGIYIKSKYKDNQYLLEREELIRHEAIHVAQQKEMLYLFFYIFYLLELLIKNIRYLNSDKAYRKVSFEQEAYNNSDNPLYIKQRSPWSWFKYILK